MRPGPPGVRGQRLLDRGRFLRCIAEGLRSHLKEQIKLAFLTGTDDLNLRLIERLRGIYPELPLWVVSDFQPVDQTLKWVPYRLGRSVALNVARIRAMLNGREVRLSAALLVPDTPFWPMRLAALCISPRGFIAFNENMDNFMLRPAAVPAMLRHAAWRLRNRFAPVVHGRPRVLIASPYVPFPLSHGGAVRMFNLMKRAAAEFDLILVAFGQGEVPAEVKALCVEVVIVRHAGRHEYPEQGRPDVVEEYDSLEFREALRDVMRRWKPQVAQLEFTQMAQYAPDCWPARTMLVEHDVTFDLYEQRARTTVPEDDLWEVRRQLDLWKRFERDAWQRVHTVIVMSERDRQTVGSKAVVIANGADLERFQPSGEEPEPGRILFIGSPKHQPNVAALDYFLAKVWPQLKDVTLHVIGGAFAVPGDLRIEVEGFVSDVRPAYRRATLVIAPLVASAGTNIKVLEAMAMGRVVVATPAGINGLVLTPGTDVVVAETAAQMAAEIEKLLADPTRRRSIEKAARATAEREFGWDAIAREQARLWGRVGFREGQFDGQRNGSPQGNQKA